MICDLPIYIFDSNGDYQRLLLETRVQYIEIYNIDDWYFCNVKILNNKYVNYIHILMNII